MFLQSKGPACRPHVGLVQRRLRGAQLGGALAELLLQGLPLGCMPGVDALQLRLQLPPPLLVRLRLLLLLLPSAHIERAPQVSKTADVLQKSAVKADWILTLPAKQFLQQMMRYQPARPCQQLCTHIQRRWCAQGQRHEDAVLLAHRRQLQLEALVLRAQVRHVRRRRHLLVDLRPVADVLRPQRILQRVLRLVCGLLRQMPWLQVDRIP